MIGVDLVKTLDKIDLVNSESKSSSSKSSSKTSNSFDDYLKNYSSNSSSDSNSSKVNLNEDSKGNKNDDTKPLKDSVKDASNKEVTVDDAKNDKDKEKASDQKVDIKSLVSMLLNSYNGTVVDLSKLKNELKNLKVSEDFQRDILQFVSKLQDSLKGKDINGYLKLLASAKNDMSSNLKGHNELINTIVNVLKAKVNKETSDLKNEAVFENKNSKFIEKAEILDTKASTQTEKNSASVIQDNKNIFRENLKENSNNDTGKNSNKSNYSKNESSYNSGKNNTSKPEEVIGKALKEDSSSDKFLKSFVSENKNDSQISKVTAFMNQFPKVNSNIEVLKEEVPAINKATFVQDIVKSVKFMESNNLKELTVKINPKELGEVVIKLSMENNIMKANISTANKETYTLLHASLADMNSNLNNHDIKIQAFSVNIYDDTTYFSGQGDSQDKSSDGDKKKERHSTSKDAATNNVTEADTSSVEEGNINVLI